MPRRAPKSRTDAPSDSHAPPVPHIRAIVRVDGTATRQKIRKDYEKTLRDVETARRQMDQFHQTDFPQFTRWLHAHFGTILTELRELLQKLAADEALILQIESEVFLGGGSHARAYHRVMEDRANPEPPKPPRDAGERGGKRNASRARPEPGNSDDANDFFEELFEGIFGDSGGAGPGPGQRGRNPSRTWLPEADAARLKELYRALARRLHPDAQQEMTPQKSAWWHQVQEAYAAGDVAQLEMILTLCDGDDRGPAVPTSAALLQRITARLKRSLRDIKRRLAELRQDPAWNFSRLADRAVLAARMRLALQADLEAMREQSREAQERLAQWKAEAERPRRPRRPKRPGPHVEDYF